jgi:hypothetical protein
MSVIGTNNCFILTAACSLLNLNSQWVGNLGKRFCLTAPRRGYFVL